MQIEFDRIGIESRKIFRGDVIFVIDPDELGMMDVQPGRLLSAGYEIHLVHPGGELLHGSEPIPERSHLPIPAGPVVLLLFCIVLPGMEFFPGRSPLFVPTPAGIVYPD